MDRTNANICDLTDESLVDMANHSADHSVNNSDTANKNGKASLAETMETNGRTCRSRKPTVVQELAEKNKAHRVKMQSKAKVNKSNQKSPPVNVAVPESPQPGPSGLSSKRKVYQNGDEDRCKRQRQQYQPFQSPKLSSTPVPNKEKVAREKATKERMEKMIIYDNGNYLAVRNEMNHFYLCRVRQNIYRNGARIKIKWYTNDSTSEHKMKQNEYRPDFPDEIDFESILTNVRVNKLEQGKISLSESEEQRVVNILQRAVNVEQGIDERPDPANVLSDGLDISVIGQAEENELLRKLKEVNNGKKKSTKVTKHNKSQTNGKASDDEASKETRDKQNLKKESNYSEKPQVTRKTEKVAVENTVGSPSLTIKQSPSSSSDNFVYKTDITTYKFNDSSRHGGSMNDEQSEERDLMFDSTVELPFISAYANSKLLIRSTLLKNYDQLDLIIANEMQHLCSVTIPRSVCISLNAIHYAILNEDFLSLHRILKIPQENLTEPSCHIQSMELHHSELMLDGESYQARSHHLSDLDSSYARFIAKNSVSLDFIQKTLAYFRNGLQDLTDNLLVSIRCGNCQLSFYLAQEACKGKNSAFNESHLMFLGRDSSRELDSDTVRQYSIPTAKVNVLHIAAINPDPCFFSSIVNHSHDKLYLADIDGWTPIHYASVSSTFFNLQYLLNLGVSTMNFDFKGNTPMHLATKMNRLENVALILSTELAHSPSSVALKAYNHKGYTPMHIAAAKGYISIVKFFIENNAEVDIVTSNNSGELTPLMIASQHGHLDIVKLLFKKGANINLVDKKNRCPLTYAVMNGHANILSTLLNYGANPSCKDIFGNNLFHYAAAYGWFFCYEIILKTNVNLKDTNMFGLTPICAAFMKGHIGIIEDILRRNILSVNVPINDSGITLLMLTFSLYPSNALITYLRLFVDQFKCDLSKTDYNGNNALHCLLQCESKYKSDSSGNHTLYEALTIVDSCDPFTANNAGISPILFALKNDCFISFMHFFRKHHQSSRFQQIISGSEHFWPLIISHLLETTGLSASSSTVARYIMNVYNQNKGLQTILKSLSLKANKHGDIVIEFFLKKSKQISSSSKSLSQELLDHEMTQFLDFLLRFYELKFLQDISLLHLAAKYSTPTIVKHLASKFFSIDGCNESNQTPLGIALLNNNLRTARALIESGAEASAKIGDLSSFLFFLKNGASSYEFALFLINFWDSITETDAEHNSALHFICRNIDAPFSLEIVKVLTAKGVDVNWQNKMGQTALHLAFQSSQISDQLCSIFDIFLLNRANLYLKDHKGVTVLDNLLKSNGGNPELVNIVQMIDTTNFDLKNFVDNTAATLLHSCAAAGNSICLSYLRAHVDAGKANSKGVTPLAAATYNQHKDCALILLQCDIDIFQNVEFASKEGSKLNIFTLMARNGWKDVLFEMLEKTKNSNRQLEFITYLIKFGCIEFATFAMKNMISRSLLQRMDLKRLLIEFSDSNATSSVDKTLQANFLKLISPEIIKESHLEVFFKALTNWNYVLCNEILRMVNIVKIIGALVHQEKRSNNFISMIFIKLCKEDRLLDQMKELVMLFIREEVNINCLSFYPIMESTQQCPRYSYTSGVADMKDSLVQYSPLIVAVIKGNYDLVKWLLLILQKNKFAVNVNFADSNQRTALMHAAMNNDLKMIKLLLDRNYNFEEDVDCWTNSNMAVNNVNEADLLMRDKNNLTLFHYLILPFDYFNYAKADLIFSFIWQLVDSNYKTADLVGELHKLAVDNGVLNIATLLEHIESRQLTVQPVLKKMGTPKTRIFHFQDDHDILLNECSQPQKSASGFIRNILQDEAAKLPFDATFTKLDSQKGHYIYNFYKLQIQTIANKCILAIRWGRVGTKGNLKRTFYETKQEAIDEFKRIFFLKSGNQWSSAQSVVDQPSAVAAAAPIANRIDDKYRMVEMKQRHLKLFSLEVDLNADHLITIKSELSIDLRDIIIRWIKGFAKCIDAPRSLLYNNLYSRLLDNCDEILQKIYPHIFNQKMSMHRDRKCSLKYMHNIIDLSEEFYNLIGIYGKEYDQLSPIMSLGDFYEKAKHVHRLKATVFAKELLFCSQKAKEHNPVDYIYDSFCYELENVLIDSEEWKFAHLYLKSAANFQFKTISFYRVKTHTEQFESSPNSHLLWYPLEDAFVFQTFAKGLQLEPMNDPNSHLIYKGLKLTNNLVMENNDPDKLRYLVLCEAKLGRIFSVAPHEAIDHCSLEDNDTLIEQPAKKSNDNARYHISWKGCTVPLRNATSAGPNDFIMLNLQNVIPRFLIEFRTIT